MSENKSELLSKSQNDYGTQFDRKKEPAGQALTPKPLKSSQTSSKSSKTSRTSSSPLKPSSLDTALNEAIGPWGRWQFRVSVLASLLKFPIAWFQLGIVFLAPATEFWCRRPPHGVVPRFDNVSLEDWKRMIWFNGSERYEYKQSLVHGSCYMHDPRSPPGAPAVRCQWGYEFNTTIFHSSIITEWQLICGREKMIDISQAVLMFGILLGTLSLGITSDRLGRKPILISCLAIQSVAGICSATVRTYTQFLLTRFIMAFANAGTMVCSFVICMEVVGGKWRTIVPILYQIPFGVGNSVMAIIAYFIRDWRQLQLVLSSLSAIYLIYWIFMPESPRWLLATGRKEEAIEILEKVAVENGLPVEGIKTALDNVPPVIMTGTQPSLKSLFNTPVLRYKTVLLCFHWLFAGISFYGFSQYMGQITKHLYAMVAIGGLISMPGTILCCFIVRRCGRRETIAGAHMFTAACYLGILAVPQEKHMADWPRVMFAALGVVGLSISTPALYLFTGEIFPTVLRNAGIGVVMMCSRVGSMLAPFVTSMSSIAPWIPLLILSVCVLSEAILVLPLPETKDSALPDTVSDAEGFVGKQDDQQKGNYKKVPKEEPRK